MGTERDFRKREMKKAMLQAISEKGNITAQITYNYGQDELMSKTE